MTNKPTYMKRIIIGSSLLFSVLLAAPQAYAQESVDVIIRENGTERREVIDLPKSMTYPVDSLLNDWKAKNYIDLGKDCSTSTVNPEFSDSVYIDRLSRMPDRHGDALQRDCSQIHRHVRRTPPQPGGFHAERLQFLYAYF